MHVRVRRRSPLLPTGIVPPPVPRPGPLVDPRLPPLARLRLGVRHRGLQIPDGPKHPEVLLFGPGPCPGHAPEERVRGQLLPALLQLPELHVEHAVISGEAEVVQRPEAEARSRPEKAAFVERDHGIEE